MGFVQADPIRAPARAQDLTLRHRVDGYRAGDLDRSYADLAIEEDFFISYGFVTNTVHALMHPRGETGVPAEGRRRWPAARRKRADLLLQFIRQRGTVHPRDVDARFRYGTVRNYWGGSSNATTHLLDAMHYRGMLRVARRDRGIRLYMERPAAHEPVDAAIREQRVDALVDVVVRLYAPLPAPSLSQFVRELRFAVPQWHNMLTSALHRARQRLARTRVDGVEWYWPADQTATAEIPEVARLLTPFDPLVRDRRRFELFWDWAYRFEAYTPIRKRTMGYYALPLLWRDRVIGWGNVAVNSGTLATDVGYVSSRAPRDRAFKIALEAEIERLRVFLGLTEERPAASDNTPAAF